MASQINITALIDNKISSLYIGRCRASGSTATAPVTARFRGGTKFLGTVVLHKYSGRWYFFSITRGAYGGGISNVPVPVGITSSIMRTAISQQTGNQSFALGILYGRFHTITVQSVSRNVGTGTINVRLSGGTSRARNAQIVFIRKNASNGKPYWFLAAVR